MKTPKSPSLSFLRPYAFLVILAPLLKVIECITELAVPFLVRAVIDQGLTPPDLNGIYGSHYHENGYIFGLLSLVFVFALVGFSLTMISQYLASRVSTDYGYALKESLYDAILRRDPSSIDRIGKGKTLNLLTSDAYALQVGVQQFMRLMVRAPFLVMGSVAAAFFVNVYAGYAVLASLACCAVVIFVVLKLTPKRYSALQSELDAISAFGEEATSGGRVIRAFNKEEKEASRFLAQSEKYRKMAMGIVRINSFINPLTFAFVNFAAIAIIYLGSFAFPSTGLSVGSIVALISFLTQSLAALLQFTRLVTSMSKAFASKKRVDSFLLTPVAIQEGNYEGNGKEGTPLFQFDRVSLSFGGEKNAVDNISLTVEEGQSVGIIGGTGSGKSTLLSLMERFLDPTEGEIRFRGIPLKEWKFSSFRGQIALVSQKPQIFHGTLRDNIVLPGATPSEEEISKAIRDSLCEEFFSHYSNGLDHVVEEGGTNLSGGQKQRLLLARAFLSKRKILFLDDATSALDYKSDLAVRNAIRSQTGMTLVMVSQRASSIKDCDLIYVLDGGKVVGRGTHDSLLSSCPIYREIYEAQVNAK
ncbi:MAG: ABC transporter ATP-binding protein [Candidatus Enteromonas sp.]|nr:ABC transporter ATP-binding protein [Candidatus Enteromonas sp.]